MEGTGTLQEGADFRREQENNKLGEISVFPPTIRRPRRGAPFTPDLWLGMMSDNSYEVGEIVIRAALKTGFWVEKIGVSRTPRSEN